MDVAVTTAGGDATAANGYVFAAAAAAEIPALSEWMLLALIAMVAMLGYGATR